MIAAAFEPLRLQRMPYCERFDTSGALNLKNGSVEIAMDTKGPFLKDAPATARELASKIAILTSSLTFNPSDKSVLVISLGLDKQIKAMFWRSGHNDQPLQEQLSRPLIEKLDIAINYLKNNCVHLRVQSELAVFVHKCSY